MAKFLTSIAFSAIYGSVGGATFARSGSGSILKKRPNGINPATISQSVARSRFSYITQSWKLLTPSERSAWIAAAPSWPHADGFGNNSPLSAYMLYISLNSNLLQIGEPTITSPPAIDSFFPYAIDSFFYSPGSSQFEVNLNGLTITGDFYIIEATFPASNGISFASSRYRVLQSSEGDNTFSSIDFYSSWIALFGSQVFSGVKSLFRIWVVKKTTGQSSPAILGEFYFP